MNSIVSSDGTTSARSRSKRSRVRRSRVRRSRSKRSRVRRNRVRSRVRRSRSKRSRVRRSDSKRSRVRRSKKVRTKTQFENIIKNFEKRLTEAINLPLDDVIPSIIYDYLDDRDLRRIANGNVISVLNDLYEEAHNLIEENNMDLDRNKQEYTRLIKTNKSLYKYVDKLAAKIDKLEK